MTRSRTRTWLALGAALAAAAVGAAVVVRAGHGTGSPADAARAEARTWSQRYARARACVVGDAPSSADGREALLLRAAAQPAFGTELASCADAVRQLAVGPRPESTPSAIEAAWYDLAQAAPTVNLLHDPKRLAKSIGDTDAALSRLRAKLALSSLPPWPGPAPLPLAPAGLLIADGGVPLIPESVEIDRDVLVVTSRSDGHSLVARMTGPNALSLHRGSEGMVRAMAWDEPGGTGWGAFAEAGTDAYTLLAVELDARGAPRGPGSSVSREPSPPTVGIEPLFASSAGDARVVVHRRLSHDEAGELRSSLAVDHSTDGGRTWQQALRIDSALRPTVSLNRARGRLDAVWNELDGALQWLEVGPGAERSVVTPPEANADARETRRCFGPSRSWWLVNGRLYYRDHDRDRDPRERGERPVEAFTLTQPELACSDDQLAAIQQSAGRVAVELCDASRCRAVGMMPAPEGSQTRHALTARGPVVALAVYDLLLMWSEGANRLEPMMRLPNDATLHGLVVWQDLVYAVLQDAARIRVMQVGDFSL